MEISTNRETIIVTGTTVATVESGGLSQLLPNYLDSYVLEIGSKFMQYYNI